MAYYEVCNTINGRAVKKKPTPDFIKKFGLDSLDIAFEYSKGQLGNWRVNDFDTVSFGGKSGNDGYLEITVFTRKGIKRFTEAPEFLDFVKNAPLELRDKAFPYT